MTYDIFDEVALVLLHEYFVALLEQLEHVVVQTLIQGIFLVHLVLLLVG